MRKPLLLLTLVLLAICFGCKKEKVIKSTNISNAQAAIMAATALSSNSNGVASIKNDIAIYAKNLVAAGKGCGVIDSFAVARQEAASSTISYNYALGYNYIVNCIDNARDNLSGNITYYGSFDAPNLSAVNSGSTNINLAPLSGTGTTYTLNGSYQTQGSFQTLDATQLSGNNSISFNIQNLVITKSSRSIVSGTADVVISGTVKNNKNTFRYDGTLMFKNDGTAVLTLDGIVYAVNLTTADVTVM